MGIYVPGITKPDHCCDCQFCEDLTSDCLLQNDAHWSTYSEQIKNCPLVEIPEPHGRLIDGDAYCENLLEEAHKVWRLLKPETIERINRTVDDLKKYPAIIEAEGSENHDD